MKKAFNIFSIIMSILSIVFVVTLLVFHFGMRFTERTYNFTEDIFVLVGAIWILGVLAHFTILSFKKLAR